jgi:hypothetical protein
MSRNKEVSEKELIESVENSIAILLEEEDHKKTIVGMTLALNIDELRQITAALFVYCCIRIKERSK